MFVVAYTCPRPDTPGNATVNNPKDMYELMESVTYSCIYGYFLKSGDLDRKCQANGTFSGAPPTCMRKPHCCFANPMEGQSNYMIFNL